MKSSSLSTFPQQNIDPLRAVIIGCGLIGGSVGMGLRDAGWHVSVIDTDPKVEKEAVVKGAADAIGFDELADICIVGAPVAYVASIVTDFLEKSSAVVTDLGSTKAAICAAIEHPRFIGGHPMAGSEVSGLAGAKPNLFTGAMWVLTPGETADENAFKTVRKMVACLGADVVVLDPSVHDQLVAQVSHVPHLTSSTLMNLAANGSAEHSMMLRLAAGGFRDMTRISAGLPNIWRDICFANKDAISRGLGELISSLQEVQQWIKNDDEDALYAHLERAKEARINLPQGYGSASAVSEILFKVLDKPGEIFSVSNLAAELGINIIDLEIMHSVQNRRGTMILLVDSDVAEMYVKSLQTLGYSPVINQLNVEEK